jgi:branched-chain amino acid transport system permease protein
LLAAAAATFLICANLLRSRTGRAWRAIRAHETVAEALGIGIAGYKLLAFVISSALASLAGALFAYYRGFVSVEAFSPALAVADYGYVLENGRCVLDGASARLRAHGDIQEFYLGQSQGGARASYRAVKQYRRSRRWYG